MGKFKNKNYKKRRGEQGNNVWAQGSKEQLVRDNAAFEAFYRRQNIVPPEDWAVFMASLRSSLPACFRVTTGRYAQDIRAALAVDTFELSGLEVPDAEGKTYIAQPPQPLEWLPEGYAWVSNIPRPLVCRDHVATPTPRCRSLLCLRLCPFSEGIPTANRSEMCTRGMAPLAGCCADPEGQEAPDLSPVACPPEQHWRDQPAGGPPAAIRPPSAAAAVTAACSCSAPIQYSSSMLDRG